MPITGEIFCIGFNKQFFYNTKELKLTYGQNKSARFAINYLNYFTEPLTENVSYSQLELDMQYTDAGWQSMPSISYLNQKLCWLFEKFQYDPKQLYAYIGTDSELNSCASLIKENMTSASELGLVLQLIIDFTKSHKSIALELSRTFITHYKNTSYKKAKEIMDKLLPFSHYLTDFPTLATLYFNAGSLALAQCNLEIAKLYFKQSEKYCQSAGDDEKIKKISIKRVEIEALSQKNTVTYGWENSITKSESYTKLDDKNSNLSLHMASPQ